MEQAENYKVDMEKSFNDLFQEVDKEKWPLFIEVQKQLLTGNPIAVGRVAKILDVTVEEANGIISQFGETNQEGEIVAFAGLSIVPTPHSFKVDGKQLFTWCAADALIFPSFFGVSAEIESIDPVNKQSINLVIKGKTIDFIQPESAFVSWVDDVDMKDIRNTMCKRIHFFVSEETATAWQKNNPGATILPAAELLKNAVNPMDCC
ncbi:MAG: hypothetical protein JKY42_07400 [Flavobacteriales bacterium]|nr:hypothetical protein [Flavobacteriales bacterium]